MSASGSRRRICWTFLAPGCPRPTGGDLARFELVNALAREGGHEVRVVHLPHDEMRIRSQADIPWFDFDGAVEHRFAAGLDPAAIPDSDVVVYSTKLLATALAPSGGTAGLRLVEELQGDRRWLPILFLQGHGVFPAAIEDLALRLPGPKVCVGSWLVKLATGRGALAQDVVHIPNGLDPQRFRIVRPIDSRSPRVAMNFDPLPVKGGLTGLEAIERLHRRLDVPATVFGTFPPSRPLPDGVEYAPSPDQATLADHVYNDASMYLQPSRREGFGMCAVEAMACGCALVTTANGGSDDYAIDGETALVCGGEPGDMVEALVRLVQDDRLRSRLAANGARFVERFRWTTSADRLARLASDRLVDRRPMGRAAPIDLASLAHMLRASGQ